MRRAPVLLLALAACGGGGPVDFDPDADPPQMLSEWRFFDYEGNRVFSYNDGVVPYDLNSPLFSDYALKDRAIYVPDGEAAAYDDDAAFDFPVGTALVKSFSFPADFRSPEQDVTIIETRLLIRGTDEWETWPYVWDADGEDATLRVGGQTKSLSFVDADGQEVAFSYLVPARNQCVTCHVLQDEDGENYKTPIGPKARHLNRDNTYDGAEDNQLEHLADLGMLTGLPADPPAAFDFRDVLARGVDDLSAEEVETAARDYLDVNCAHCHNPMGVSGVTSQLWLNHDNEDAFHYGVCKRPGSAGPGAVDRTFDVVPGDHEASILWYRMQTTEVGAMMPQIGRSLAHAEGVELVAAWIDGLEGTCSE